MRNNLLNKFLSSKTQKVKVYNQHNGDDVLMGELLYDVENKKSYFQWSDDALKLKIEWSPLHLKLSENPILIDNTPPDFHSLPGMINDSLPDGWGLMLFDKKFRQMGVDARKITPAFKLACLGDRVWGSLRYEPEFDDENKANINLSETLKEINEIYTGSLKEVSQNLLIVGGSPHGARPKIFVDINQNNDAVTHSTNGDLENGYEPWIVKFQAPDEHRQSPILEYIYMLLAKKMGLDVMESKIIPIDNSYAFATKRFDRENNRKIFTHSLSGILNQSHRDCNLDYINVVQVLNKLDAKQKNLEELFKRACFNVALSVRDDHSKNISFVYKNNQWSLSPAYDLTFMEGPGGYHSMNIADSTRQDPNFKDLLNLSRHCHLDDIKAKQIIEESIDVSREFKLMAKNYDIENKLQKDIDKRLNEILKGLNPVKAPSIKSKKY